MPQNAPPPSSADAPDAGVSFVLRCRRETPASGPGRLYFRLQQVGGVERSWRFTELDQVFETLQAEITRLLGDDTTNETTN